MAFIKMKGLVSGVVALAVLAVIAQEPKNGTTAPDFTATSIDGKTHTLKSLTEKGPVILYFIKQDCPVNNEMAKYYGAIATAYKGKSQQLVGVLNGDKRIAEAYARRHKAEYPILLDPDHKIIRAYKAKFSPWAVAVDKSGHITKVWEGASQAALAEMNTLMAETAKVDPAKLDFSTAPKRGSGG